MNVIAGSGLVGIVTDVGPNYAKVTSIINDTAQVSGMVTTTSDNLIVNGSLQNMNENMVIEFSNLMTATIKWRLATLLSRPTFQINISRES